ncbi:hypothetical protein F2P81_003577 [Scophthalmus maximus]|uniref:nucleoside diphosphate phosphatase n=1 Tax=Scophthalmus maximus TaxID=52904 RepID=A0A6A4THU0_SCOMX|nr:hypothetical protein F2P81_003577 [Scophthalmus maximus]
MAPPSLLFTFSVWLLAAVLAAEATYYRHHRYVPHFYRYREHSAQAENLLPEVSHSAPAVPQPGVPTYPEIPEVFHPAPEVIPPIPEAFHPVPEVVHPAPEPYRRPEAEPLPEVSSPGGNTVRQLLKIAKKTVPEDEWKRTPVVLKATAGLRLLPEDKASALLKEVREVFDESPFFVPNNSVSIMNGANEGLDWKIFTSSCLPKKFREDVTFGGTTYKVGGIPDGYAGYKLCYYEVMKVIKGIVLQPYEVKGSSIFYAFSYYFDRAVESGLIDASRGGAIEVRDFKKRAKEVCNKMTKYRAISPFLCMDMTYITCLLKEGFGFKDNTVLQLAKKVNNVETSWALGATFDYFRDLNIH